MKIERVLDNEDVRDYDYISMSRKLRVISEEKYTKNKEEFMKLLEPAERVLDIGCCDGNFSRTIADATGEKVYGIEIVREFAKHAKMKEIDVVLADANKLFPFKDCSFDAAISNQVIEHINDTDSFVNEIYRVLKPGGYCVISTENLASLHNIFSLMLGYQPFSSHVSDEVFLGNPLNPSYKKKHKYSGSYYRLHRRIFVARSLEELFEWHGFEVEMVIGTAMYPSPKISRLMPQAIMKKYGANIILKARKSGSTHF